MKVILNIIVRIIVRSMDAIGMLLIVVMLVLLAGAAYIDLADPRPRKGTDECEAKQEAIFKGPIDRSISPTEYVRRVNRACK